MNGTTKPSRASASDTANPRKAYVRVSPADSGWRAVDVMYAAHTMPTPIPGPMAERPYPRVPTLPVTSASCSTASDMGVLLPFHEIRRADLGGQSLATPVRARWCRSGAGSSGAGLLGNGLSGNGLSGCDGRLLW